MNSYANHWNNPNGADSGYGASLGASPDASFVRLPARITFGPMEADTVIREWIKAFGGRQELYPAGRVIFRQGDTASDVFLLVDGLAVLKCNVADGREAALTIRVRGQLIDCCCHGLGIPHFVSAYTITPTKLLCLPAAELRLKTVASAAGADLLRQMVQIDAYSAATSVVALKMASPAIRFEQFLRAFATATSQEREIESIGVSVPLPDAQLAEIIGLSTRQFARVKRQMQNDGVIQHNDARRFTLRRTSTGRAAS